MVGHVTTSQRISWPVRRQTGVEPHEFDISATEEADCRPSGRLNGVCDGCESSKSLNGLPSSRNAIKFIEHGIIIRQMNNKAPPIKIPDSRNQLKRSRITPAPYEKAQAFEEICKRAAHPSSKLD